MTGLPAATRRSLTFGFCGHRNRPCRRHLFVELPSRGSFVVDLSGPFKNIYGESLRIARGLPEWLPHCLLNRLHGGDETRIRHGRPRFALVSEDWRGPRNPSICGPLNPHVFASWSSAGCGDFGPQTRPQQHAGIQELVWQPRVGSVGLGGNQGRGRSKHPNLGASIGARAP